MAELNQEAETIDLSELQPLRIRRYHEQDGLCLYCGCKMLLESEHKRHPQFATKDHLIPRSFPDNPRTPENIKLACSACNNLKGAMTDVDFIAMIQVCGSMAKVKYYCQWSKDIMDRARVERRIERRGLWQMKNQLDPENPDNVWPIYWATVYNPTENDVKKQYFRTAWRTMSAARHWCRETAILYCGGLKWALCFVRDSEGEQSYLYAKFSQAKRPVAWKWTTEDLTNSKCARIVCKDISQ